MFVSCMQKRNNIIYLKSLSQTFRIHKERKPMNSFKQFLLEANECAVISQQHLKDLEKFADGLLNKWGIDIEFSKHFADRCSDSRNDPCIKISELQQLFKK